MKKTKMMKRCALALLLAALVLSGCGKRDEPDAPEQTAQTVEYSNLNDASSKELLAKLFADAGIAPERSDKFFACLDQFNGSVKAEWLTDGFETADPTETKYDPYEMQDMWMEKQGDFPGYNCRITAFLLFGDHIAAGADQPETNGEDSLFMDLETLKRDLDWIGLDWDEEQTPQSMRADAYHAEFERLRALGLVYPCYCSRAELHAASAPHASDGNVIYAGTCRSLTAAERTAKIRKPAWRVIVPDTVITVQDGLQGAYSENLARDCGDFIIRRSDGVYAYQLAVVTDDAAGGITEVIRGRDLLSSVPRQMWLQKTLGFPTPAYYHVPLLLAPDGRRLSKREKSLDLGALRERCTPEQLVGTLAFLAGLQPEPAPAAPSTLVSGFLWKNVRSDNVVIHSEFRCNIS